MAEIGQMLDAEVTEALADEPAPRVHFVGHSLGAVVIRWLLVNDPPASPGRAVLLAPPNQGSHEAGRLVGFVGWALVPSGHTVIMMRPHVMGMVRAFLATGELPGASDAACVGVMGS